MLAFASGLVLSMIGSLPPGVISVSVAQRAMSRGLQAAVWMSVGAAMVEFFQAFGAVVFADWFLSHPAVEQVFRWVTAPVFLVLGGYFLFSKVTPTSRSGAHSNQADFWHGAALSIFNFLAIPYWIFYCGWLKTEGWLIFNLKNSLLLSAGVFVGTTIILAGYGWLGRRIFEKSAALLGWVNIFLGLVFLFSGLKILLSK